MMADVHLCRCYRAVVIVSVAIHVAASGAFAELQTIALSGEAAPDTSWNFTYFEAPIINSVGDVAFIASLDDDEFDPLSGYWSNGTGVLSNVALSGQTAPGVALDFVPFGGDNIFINNVGQAGFGQTLSDFSTYGFFAQTGAGDTLEKIVAGGDPAPGTVDPNRVFHDFLGTVGSFNSFGDTGFQGSMPPTTGPGNFPSSGIWFGAPGVIDKVAEVGDPAPAPLGTAGLFSQFRTPAVNDSRQIAFVAQTTSGVPTGEGVWMTDTGGTLKRVAVNGESAPGGGT
ncbi:MAG: hypothetical protein MI741_18705, partial [Rhodospirillales bacterium]|nr:hypothetical protein [Rhodospirillales bacterium]